MIAKLFPKGFPRYQSLPIMGPLIDKYSAWLIEQQYTYRSSRYELCMVVHICRFLKKRGFQKVNEIGVDDLEACYRFFRKKFTKEAGSVRVLSRFLMQQSLVQPASIPELTRKGAMLNEFKIYLRDIHGFADSTIQRQAHLSNEFLEWLKFDETPNRLSLLQITEIEAFIQHLGKRMARVSLQKPISIIRNLLKFLAMKGVVPPGMENLIESPRVYRQEKLPRSLPWEIVRALIRSIDRSTTIGKRDYAIFSLMATYGLRSCDIVALKLNDINWRKEIVRIYQTKTGNPFELPLTLQVGSAIYEYLQAEPRHGDYREVFLRAKAPAGILKPTAVIEAFQAWSRKSGLAIPYKGAHCIRHSYALHMVRHGIPLKTIGDLLGHKSPESTSTYIRLAVEDLRGVALHIPNRIEGQKETKS